MAYQEPIKTRIDAFRAVTSPHDDGQVTLAKIQLAMAMRRRRLKLAKGASIGLLSLLVSGAGFAGFYRLANRALPRQQQTSVALDARPVSAARSLAVTTQASPAEIASRPATARDTEMPRGPVVSDHTHEETIYQRAHRLHFQGKPSEQALGAWNRYLKLFPKGHYAPEARFNRAICLVKLKRHAEAKEALLPIAEESTYHASSARRLLRKLHAATINGFAGDN